MREKKALAQRVFMSNTDSRRKLMGRHATGNRHDEDWTPSQLLGYIGKSTRTGQQIRVTLMRNGHQLDLSLPVQK